MSHTLTAPADIAYACAAHHPDMTAQPIPQQPRHPSGSPDGGRFAHHQRHESDLALAPVPEWQPTATDFADENIPLPRSFRQPGEGDDYLAPEDEYMGSDEQDFWADYGEQQWFGGTLAGGR